MESRNVSIRCHNDDSMLTATQGYASRGAVLLAVPRQLRLSTAGLVPEPLLQDLDRRVSHRHRLHAACHDLHPLRSPQVRSVHLPSRQLRQPVPYALVYANPVDIPLLYTKRGASCAC